MHRKFIGLLVLAIVLALSGLIMLITGIVLLTRDKSCDETSPQSDTDRCSYSDEAARSGLDRFLQKVKDSYYRLHPNKIAWKDGVTPSEIREKYRSYDPSPRNIKLITDESWALLKEINEAGINAAKLKPREKKSVAQVKHYLQHVFGNPYEVNYYAGDFLMGPNLWCWQPLCDLPYDFRKSLQYFKPINANDLETLGEKLAEVNQTFTQYRKNMEYGVTAGMVRSVEQCLAGINGLTSTFRHISSKGAIGVFDESFVKNLLQPEFLIDLTNNTDEARSWETKYGKSANESLRGFLLDSVGKPIEDFFTFLRTENLQHCVSNDVSSGFATLPLPFVYVNNTADKSRPTTKSLPTGEPLNGTKSYAQIVTFFTTNSMTPDEIHQLGFKMLNELYPQVLEVARIITEKKDNDTAKLEFIKRMNASDLYFNNEEIPKNESDERAHVLCGDVEGAKKYCPTRWRAIQNWFAEAHMALSFLDPKTIKMFHFNGAKHTTPNCPIEMSPHFNPSRGANYNGADEKCSTNARYNLPFFSEKPGPRYEEWSTNAHEGRPGHHTQVQGLIEHFRDSCGGVIKWLDEETYYTAFSEGWGLYAENPLVAQDTDTYNGKPWQKYGMLKWQVWRALRLIVDTGLHYKGFSRQKALQFFADFAWDKSGTALKEVTRYQSAPGQATAYMIGQQHIKKLRDYSEGKLGDQFNLRDFHYQLLSQGSSPLSYLQLSIEAYVDCVKDEKAAGCYDVLNPAVKDDDAEDDDVINSEDGEAIKRPRPHYV